MPRSRSQNNMPKRRKEILDGAARVFFEKGYDAASTQDIADAVGLLKGSLYHYIASKEDFLYEIVKTQHEGALEALDKVRRIEGDALVRMAALIDTHVEFFTSNFIGAVVFFREFRALSPERQAEIRPKGDEYLNFVRDLLRQGQQEGTITSAIDIRASSLAIVGMLNSLALWYHATGRLTPRNLSKQFASLILTGVFSDAGSSRGADEVRAKVLASMDQLNGRARKSAAKLTS